MTGRLLVRGRGGLLDGVQRVLEPGRTLVVGRSRSCHISLRRTPAFARHPDREALVRSTAFNRVSRIHCEIECLADGRIEVRDLSRNGTFVNDARVLRACTMSPRDGPVHVELADPSWGRLSIGRG